MIKMAEIEKKQLIIQELEQASDPVLDQVWAFLKFLKSMQAQDYLEPAMLSESALQKDWLRSEEESAWQDL